MTKTQAEKVKELSKVLEAIRRKCLCCSAFNRYEVLCCNSKNCSLYPYRMGVTSYKSDFNKGKNPKQSKNDELEGGCDA